MKKFAVLLFLLFILSGCGQKKVQIAWTAPTDGAPVDHYVLVVKHELGDLTFETSETRVTVKLEKGGPYVAVVAGVAANGKQGEWSELSDPFTVR